jgi:hypothetical protein
MNWKKQAWVMGLWMAAGCFLMVSVAVGTVLAAESGGGTAAGAAPKAAGTGSKAAEPAGKAAEPAAKATTSAKSKPKTVTGMVEKTPTGLILKARREIYTLSGKDLSSMVGKKVKITGTVTKTDKGSAFHVMRAQEVKPTKPLPMR